MVYNHLWYSYSLCCRCDVGDWTQGLPHVRQVHDSKLSYTLPRWFSYAVAIHLFLVKYAETEAVSSATSCVGYRARTPMGVWSCFVSPLELCLWPTSAGFALPSFLFPTGFSFFVFEYNRCQETDKPHQARRRHCDYRGKPGIKPSVLPDKAWIKRLFSFLWLQCL